MALAYLPYQWHTYRVVFLPKPGCTDYTLAKSFHPISLSSYLLKMIERLIDKYIKDRTLIRHPLNKNQHATWLVNLQAGCPSCHPTNSIKALKASVEVLKPLEFEYFISKY